MSSTNRGHVRPANDFFETPAWVVDAIVPHLPAQVGGRRALRVVDAGAGRGAISIRLIAAGYTSVCGIEIDEANAEACNVAGVDCVREDFLTSDHPKPDLVVMNPPFTHAEAFVRHALHLVGDGHVFALLRLAFLEGITRAPLHRAHPSDVFVLPRRPSFTGGGTDSSAYAWFGWGPGRGGRWSVLDVPAGRA